MGIPIPRKMVSILKRDSGPLLTERYDTLWIVLSLATEPLEWIFKHPYYLKYEFTEYWHFAVSGKSDFSDTVKVHEIPDRPPTDPHWVSPPATRLHAPEPWVVCLLPNGLRYRVSDQPPGIRIYSWQQARALYRMGEVKVLFFTCCRLFHHYISGWKNTPLNCV